MGTTDSLTALADLSAAIGHAQYVGFSEIEYEDRDWDHYRQTKEDRRVKKTRRPNARHDIEVHAVFPQSWGSTALGFGGIGGQAFTGAYTIVLECNGEYAVYFSARHAYTIKGPKLCFFEDVAKQRMCFVDEAHKYKNKEPQPTP